MSSESNETNPLLDAGLPRFASIRPEHALPAIEQRLAEYRQLIARIEALGDAVDYASVVEAETLADNALSTAWSSISHLNSVNNTPEWREAYTACLEPLTRFSTERGQNPALYQAYRTLSERADFAEQTPAMRASIEHELRDFRLAGVALPEAERARFAEIKLKLSKLSNRFGNQVLDATEGYSEHFESADALAGLPDSDLNMLASLARQADKDGWLANLSYPAYRAIITYADDRALRERFHRAFATRASDRGPQAGEHDNGPLVREILELRQEQAELLGFSDFASLRLSTRMAESSAQVESFLDDLARRARPMATAQLAELEDFAARQGAETPLAPWDIPYYAEKLREERLGINQERLKPWFELKRCFDGLFTVAGELFGLRFEADEQVETWHEDVHFYRVLNDDGQALAGLYLDLYARARKSGGAWMDVCRSRLEIDGHSQQPIAFLTCNFSAPSPGHPSLLTHDDLVTLFHEFGHCLHHLLTRVELPGVGGISGVEWDAVELPSQLLEGWAWEAESLNRYARHYETDEPLPPALLEGLRADRQFHGALALLRQIEFALTDLSLHRQAGADPVAIMREVHDRVGVTPMLEDNRYIMSFSHLFDGGYGAGYYSYLWAERLARDAFHLFIEEGLFERRAGQRLAREILEVGSSRPMADSWQAFRGREAALEPLLDAYGVQ
ncbi:M3 family metallopeptidase [Wenzhouxiangella marina]|uniref:oligopeptidase A n=1 Tax=Wenzhouxiangella marina TaxID=1579979 RepID=A0A0K0XUI2_9GAMM|nr:M3 family metallopeptidase [Wenzhouxiangella marina]AKS41343.1 Zn-dependent oligopeptidase [Wenzhouxiangella marina]MBB6086907.1 oligopeptidase A [Wenzhouxiangella marina]